MNSVMDLQVQENDIDVQLPQSTDDYVVLAKRQKLNTNDLLTFDSSIRESDVCLTGKLTPLHTNLSQAEASGIQFCKTSPRIEEFSQEEEQNLKRQEKAEEITIVELENCSESYMSQTKSITEDIIMDLPIEHIGMIPSCFEDPTTSTTIHDKNMEAKLVHTLEEDHVSQGIDFHITDLDAAMMEIFKSNSEREIQWEGNQALPSRVMHVNEFEEEFHSAKDIISNLSAAMEGELPPEEQLISLQRKLDSNASEVEQLMKVWQTQNEEISPGDETFQSGETEALSSFFENELSCYQGVAPNSRCFVDDILGTVHEQSIKELDSIFDAPRNSSHKLYEVKFEASKENIEIRRRNIELLNENSQLIECMMQQAAKDQSKLNAAEIKIVELQDKLETMSALQKDMEVQTIELIEANIRIEELTSQRTERLNEFEDLGFAGLQQERAQTQNPLCKYLESLKQRVTLLEGKCTELTLKLQKYESMESGVLSETTSDEYHYLIEENVHKAQLGASRRGRGELGEVSGDKEATNIEVKAGKSSDQHQSASDSNEKDEFSSEANVDGVGPDDDIGNLAGMKPEERKLLIKFGKFYILVSDARYFKIDWNKHRESRQGFRYSCRDCPKKFNNLTDMQDHLWSQHYGGQFKCPYCRSVHKFKWRKNFKNHMKNDHGNGYYIKNN